MKRAQKEVSEAAPESSSFDARLAALEAVAAELEAGELPLERAIERYQHGIALLKQCQQELDAYKRKVEELSVEAEQSLRSRDEGLRARGDGETERGGGR
jgi:exodeoxyribonuclease VII small subunit